MTTKANVLKPCPAPQCRPVTAWHWLRARSTSKFAIPHLKASRGHLILTGSRAGHSTIPGSVYGATKWFIRGYADNLNAELSGTGARVTNINPGMVDTPFFDNPKPDALRSEDIAGAFMYVIEQPAHVSVPSVQIYPQPKG